MIAAISYLFRYYFRSYRYVAPLMVFVTVVIFIYGIVPNPVLSSFGFTSTALFLASAWLCFAYIDVEDHTQQMITVLHMGSVTKYYAAKLSVMALIGTALAVSTTIYPILFDKFVHQPTATEFVVGLVSHLLLSYLGIAIAALFTSKLIRKLNYSILGLFLMMSLSLAGMGISDRLPDGLSFLTWIIPPLNLILEMLNQDESIEIYEAVVAFSATLIYVSALQLIFFRWMKKRLF